MMDVSKLAAPFPPEMREGYFMAKVMPEPNSGCWLWTGSANKQGYGNFWHNGRCWKAHRFSYLLHHGAIEDDLDILHTCDTTACVNPAHLRSGTHSDNMQDLWRKGRGNSRKGVDNPKARLDAAAVTRLRSMAASGHPTTYIAECFQISTSQARRIIRRGVGGWRDQ